jgi:hypothetical protein
MEPVNTSPSVEVRAARASLETTGDDFDRTTGVRGSARASHLDQREDD